MTKRYKVIPNPDGTSDVVKQPGAVRKVWHWYWSALLYLVAWSLIFRGHVVWLVVVLSVVCMIVERGIKGARNAKRVGTS